MARASRPVPQPPSKHSLPAKYRLTQPVLHQRHRVVVGLVAVCGPGVFKELSRLVAACRQVSPGRGVQGKLVGHIRQPAESLGKKEKQFGEGRHGVLIRGDDDALEEMRRLNQALDLGEVEEALGRRVGETARKALDSVAERRMIIKGAWHWLVLCWFVWLKRAALPLP
jgi:hypothetical protein